MVRERERKKRSKKVKVDGDETMDQDLHSQGFHPNHTVLIERILSEREKIKRRERGGGKKERKKEREGGKKEEIV